MTHAPALLVERDGSILRLTLNRPDQGNALDQEMGQALLAEAIRCDNDDSIRCVVLTGSGRMFCAGGDVGAFVAAGDDVSTMISEGTYTLHTALTKLARMAKPLLVLVNGPAAGAGLSMALMGDIVVASSSAHFTAGYSAIGMTPDGGMTWLLPKLVGLRRAQEMIVTNRRIDAEEAITIGLVTRVVSSELLTEEGNKLALTLSHAATDAIAAARSLLLQSFSNGLETQLELEARSITQAGSSANAREGFAAFVDRRKPVFGT